MENRTLKCVHIIFRHGNRTAFGPYDVKPLNLPDVTWPQGYQVLTESGKERMFRLGEYFCQQYAELITDDLKRLKVNCSTTDRCSGSATQVLKAMFPDEYENISIELGICGEKNGLTMSLICKKVEEMFDQQKKCPPFLKYLELNSDLMQQVADAVGANKKSSDMVYAINDNYVVYKDHGIALPPWYTDQMEQKIKTFLGHAVGLMLASRQISRLSDGFLFQALSERLTEMNFSQSDGVKMYLYSTHDWTLMSFLSILGVFDNQMPPYGASVAMEVHQIGVESYLKFLYMPESDSRKAQLLKLPMANGEDMCPVKTFVDSLHDLIPNDEDFKCEHGPH